MNSDCPLLGINDKEIHIWSIPLDASALILEYLSALLSPDELHRAASFHFDCHRNAFVISRGLLRVLLSRYHSIQPQDIQFSYGPAGKPALAGGMATDSVPLRFNFSRSVGLGLYAIAVNQDVGIDVEVVRPLPDLEQIAKQFFNRLEYGEIAALPMEQKLEAFFTCWTRKEAYVKADGEGLSISLSRFRVSLLRDQPAELLAIEDGRFHPSDWTLCDLQPSIHSIGALAYRGSKRSIFVRQFSSTVDALQSLSWKSSRAEKWMDARLIS